MEIFVGIVVGTAAGGLAALLCRNTYRCLLTSMAVGILGGLLGLVSEFWIAVGDTGASPTQAGLASGLGAVLTLLLWLVAQRLFLASPPPMGDA